MSCPETQCYPLLWLPCFATAMYDCPWCSSHLRESWACHPHFGGFLCHLPASVPWGPQWVWAHSLSPVALGPEPLAQFCCSLPLDVQQHEYSYFLFKTNLEPSLSKGLLITKKCLRQKLIDRPTWALLRNKLAIGSATYKERC